MTTATSRRQLPQVKENRKKAIESRYYKQKTNKYISDTELVLRQKDLEKRRVFAYASNNYQKLLLRAEVIKYVEEEKALLERDVQQFDKVDERIERQRRMLQQDKYRYKRADLVKPLPPRAPFNKLEPRQPQIKVNLAQIYPYLQQKKHFQDLYVDTFFRKVESRLGEKCVDWVRKKHISKEVEEMELWNEFLPYFQKPEIQFADGEGQEKEKEAAAIPDDSLIFLHQQYEQEQEQEQMGQPQDAEEEYQEEQGQQPEPLEKDLTFITRQSSTMYHQPQRQQPPRPQLPEPAKRILDQIQEMRKMLQAWEQPPSESTKQRLQQCKLFRKKKVRKPKPCRKFTTDKNLNSLEFSDDDDDNDEDSNTFRGFLPPIKERSSRATSGSSSENDAEEELIQKLRQLKKNVRSKKANDTGLSPIPSEGISREPTLAEDSDHSRPLTVQDVTNTRQSVQKVVNVLKKKKVSTRVSREMPSEDEVHEMTPEQLAAFQESWKEVLKCRYIRGHEPAVMQLPTGPITDFVFSGETNQTDSTATSEAANYTLHQIQHS